MSHVYVIEMLGDGWKNWVPLPTLDGEDGIVAFRLRKRAVTALKDNAYGQPDAMCPPVVFGERVRYRVRRYVNP